MDNAQILYARADLGFGNSGAAPLGENVQPHGLRVYQGADKGRRICKSEIHAENSRQALADKFLSVKILLPDALKDKTFGYAPLAVAFDGIAARVMSLHIREDGLILIREPFIAPVGCSSREDVRVWRIKETCFKP